MRHPQCFVESTSDNEVRQIFLHLVPMKVISSLVESFVPHKMECLKLMIFKNH